MHKPSGTCRRRTRRGAGSRPARRPPEHLPRDLKVYLPLDDDACPAGGDARRQLGEDVAEQLKCTPASFHVIRHVRPKLACGCCNAIVHAPAPSRPIKRGIAGRGLLAHVLVAKFADHLPLYRQSVIYARRCRPGPCVAGPCVAGELGSCRKRAAAPVGRRNLEPRAGRHQTACRRHASADAGTWKSKDHNRALMDLCARRPASRRHSTASSVVRLLTESQRHPSANPSSLV